MKNDPQELKKVLTDTKGPLGEWASRAIVERDFQLSQWVTKEMSQASEDALRQISRGFSLEVWCSARKSMANAWKERTGHLPLLGKTTPESVYALALTASPGRLKSALEKLSSEDLLLLKEITVNGKGLIEDILSLPWSNDPSIRHRQMKTVMILNEKGLPFPEGASVWSSFLTMWNNNGVNEGWESNDMMLSFPVAWWGQFSKEKPWPPCLLPAWLETLKVGAQQGVNIEEMVSAMLLSVPPQVEKEIGLSFISPSHAWKHHSTSWHHMAPHFIDLACVILPRMDWGPMEGFSVRQCLEGWVEYQGAEPPDFQADKVFNSPYSDGHRESLPYMIFEYPRLMEILQSIHIKERLVQSVSEENGPVRRVRL